MGTKYILPLKKPVADATTIYKTIVIGDKQISFQFQWSIASEEQYNIIEQYVNTKMRSDPFLVNGSYVYQYDYINYYARLYGMSDEQLNDWLDANPLLPNSIALMSRDSQLQTLRQRIEEAAALKAVINHYREEMSWHFQATYRSEITTGVMELGGWYRSQDPELQFRFVSQLTHIGKNDFDNVTLEFEVDND